MSGAAPDTRPGRRAGRLRAGVLGLCGLLAACGANAVPAGDAGGAGDVATEDRRDAGRADTDAAGDADAADAAGDADAAPAAPPAYLAEVVELAPGEGGGFGEDDLPAVVQGPPRGGGENAGSTDVLSLGHGGTVVVAFDVDLVDGPGDDLAVFENACGIL